MKKLKEKKSIVALLALVLVGAIGGVFAFYTSTASFDNIFKSKPFSAKFEEVFESPESWIPGATTDKEVYATNNGEVDVAVRVSYTEKWVSANGTTLSGVQDENQAAIINFANTSDWIKVGNYYVYNKKLTAGETTTSFIDSVTFNEEITADYVCTTEGNTKTCTSTGNGYDGATYTLTVNIDVIQFDAAESQWNLNNFTWAA